MASEEGAYLLPMKYEAHKATVTKTHCNSGCADGWGAALSQTPTNSYSALVVLGQVMSFNDPHWQVFFAYGSSRTTSPTDANLQVGRHIAQDKTPSSRLPETVGYFLFEASPSTPQDINNGFSMISNFGSDKITGADNWQFK